MAYIPLHVKSHYELLESTLSVKDIIYLAKNNRLSSIAMANKTMYGMVKFYQEATEQDIKPIMGLEVKVSLDKTTPDDSSSLFVYARNESGYKHLIQLSSETMTAEKIIPLKDVLALSDGLIFVIPSRENQLYEWLDAGESKKSIELLREVKSATPAHHCFLGVDILHTTREFIDLQKEVSKLSGLPLLAFDEIRSSHPQNTLILDILGAIKSRETLDSERLSETQSSFPAFQFLDSLERKYEEYDLSQAVAATEKIADNIHAEIKFGQHLLPKYPLPEGESSDDYLTNISERELQKRIENPDNTYVKRLEKELDVIKRMGFSDYFLIVWDVVAYAKKNGIQTGAGRGSAAGSLVAYALGIIEVDPIKYHLIFERFLNEERFSPPDIDLDFPDNKREEIIDYLQNRYGSKNVAQIITFGRMGAKQSLRDAGRSLGLSQAQQSEWSRTIPSQPGITLEDAYRESKSLQKLVNKSKWNKIFFSVARQLEGTPRNISTHASGLIIHDDPLVEKIPVQDGGSSLLQSQYEMDDLEEIGLLKFDVLGLRNLTILADAKENVHRYEDAALDYGDIPLDDSETIEIFQEADTLGIFQFESDGIRRVLKQLQPTTFEDIVAVNALYRPGPMGQISHYIDRKHGKEEVTYLHEDLEEILSVTNGIMIYQEQVMQVASKIAGFTMGEADLLRRAMGNKDHHIIAENKQKFREGALKKGYSEEFIEQIYHLIDQFADYGFNRSHAVAYSMIAFQLAYIKAHYPAAFYAALLNSSNQGKYKVIVPEAKKKGISFHSPDVNSSEKGFIAQENKIIFGLDHIKTLSRGLADEIIRERENGKYPDFIQFISRIHPKHLKEDDVEALIYSGSFDSLGMTRGKLIYNYPSVLKSVQLKNKERNQTALGLVMTPYLKESSDLPLREKLEKEREYLGLIASHHPSENFDELRFESDVPYTLEATMQKKITLLGTLFDLEKIRTKKGETMGVGILSDELGILSLTLFPEEYRKLIKGLKEGQTYLFKGDMNQHKGQKQLIITDIKYLDKEAYSKRIFVRITENRQDIGDKLKKLTARHTGLSKFFIYVETTKETYKNRHRVEINSHLLKDLIDNFGEENVAVVDKSEEK